MNISQVAVNELALLHIVGNQTVIGRVKAKSDASITLSDPIELVIMLNPQNPQAAPVIGLMPFLSMQMKLSSLEEVELQLSQVITPRPVPPQLEKDYLSSTSSLDLSSQLPPGIGGLRR